MVTLTLSLCLVFTVMLFLAVFTTEDQVFVNQLKAEKNAYINHLNQSQTSNWPSSSRRYSLFKSIDDLSAAKGIKDQKRISQQVGIHEYFDSNSAYFIYHFINPKTNLSEFLVFDVSDLLAVRDSKLPILITIIIFTFLVTVVSLLVSRRLAAKTLQPVKNLSNKLQHGELDEVVIELANQFSEDEIGVLTHELALALTKVRESSQREFEFNRGVSHELRSPIQVAQATTEIMELRLSGSPSETQQNIQQLKRSITEMNEIVEAFLWLASDKETNTNDNYSILELRKTISNLQESYSNINIEISSELDDEHVYPIPKKVGAVIVRNLIRNAVSHGDGKTISLNLLSKTISFQNTIPDANKNSESFGIGISIVKHICERFGCDLEIKHDQDNTYLVDFKFGS